MSGSSAFYFPQPVQPIQSAGNYAFFDSGNNSIRQQAATGPSQAYFSPDREEMLSPFTLAATLSPASSARESDSVFGDADAFSVISSEDAFAIASRASGSDFGEGLSEVSWDDMDEDLEDDIASHPFFRQNGTGP